MTVGSLYQINSNNVTNNFLDNDPQISYFKVVYRKHTRFAMENIKFDNLDRSKLSNDEEITIQCDIPRNGNLLKNIYLTFELPNVYSGSSDVSSESRVNYEFQWIKNIGINIFKSVKLKINQTVIDTLHSDYINIWKELHYDEDEKKIFNENIGHVKELYDPANSPGQNGIYPNITTSLTDKYYDNSSKIKVSSLSSDYSNVFPSIKSRKIKVPIPFSFFQNSGVALPLVALQYSTCSLEFKMRKFTDLYTLISDNSISLGERIKPTETNNYITKFTDNFNLNINPNVEGEYIFLDKEELSRFAKYSHEYIFEQSTLLNENGYHLNLTNQKTSIDLMGINGPVKYLTWVLKRDDLQHINEWNNYTNWVYPEVPPYSNEYFYKNTYYDVADNKNIFLNVNDSTHDSSFTLENTEKTVLKNFELKLDGNSRIDKNSEYFNRQQMLQHFGKKPQDGIYVYSFSLNPTDQQPSGSCNFSSIEKTTAIFTKNNMDGKFSFYNFRIYLYTVKYNILVIKNGIGGLKYVN